MPSPLPNHSIILAKAPALSGRLAAMISTVVWATLERKLLALVILLALSRGFIYATVLPAWDLNDEEQHFHYVQQLAETWQIPLMGASFLSPEILASVAETDRWQHLGLTRPQVIDPRLMGLEGYSYEAYQPPLYYLVLAIPYKLASMSIPLVYGDATDSTNTLMKLYFLRFVTVALSAVSLAVSYVALRQVFAARLEIAVGGTLLLSLIPERTMALSRVNNDSLVEFLGAATLLFLLKSVDRPFTRYRSLLLGMLLGLAILAKLTALVLVPLALLVMVWQAFSAKRWARLLAHGCIVLATAIVVSGWFLARNLWLYGDLTGGSAFLNLVDFRPRYTLSDMLITLSRAFWATRWVGTMTNALAILMALVWLMALVGLVARLIDKRWSANGESSWTTIVLLIIAAVLWVIPLWFGTRTGIVQHVEGRFVAASYAPAVALLLLGLSRVFDINTTVVIAGLLAIFFAAFDLAYVLLFLLPGYYFREAFDFTLFFVHKPDFVNLLSVIAISLSYLVSLSFLLRALWGGLRPDHRSLTGDVADAEGDGAR